MISLRNLTQSFPKAGLGRPVLDNITADIPTNRRFGILGGEAAGKTTLMRLLAGFDKPKNGTIARYARLSFPIAYEGVFKRHLSPQDNLAQFTHAYGQQIEEISAFVRSVTDMDSMFETPLAKLPQELQRRFVFAASYALPFDCYLIDERFAGGPADDDFKPKCTAMLQARAASSGIILASRRPHIVQRFCDKAAVLENGRLTLYDDVATAIDAFKEVRARKFEMDHRSELA